MKLIKWLVFLSINISSIYAFNIDDLLHPTAHAGGSYIITHSAEVVCRQISDWNKTTCSIVGGLIAMGAGIAVEMTQSESKSNHARSYIENASGIMLAIGVIHVDF